MKTLYIFLVVVELLGFILAQSLFLIGGDFQSTNEEAWNRIIDAAVGNYHNLQINSINSCTNKAIHTLLRGEIHIELPNYF